MDLHTPYSTVSFRMTLSDLAKYSMTRSIARPLCDSRATCSTLLIVGTQHDNWNTRIYRGLGLRVVRAVTYICLIRSNQLSFTVALQKVKTDKTRHFRGENVNADRWHHHACCSVNVASWPLSCQSISDYLIRATQAMHIRLIFCIISYSYHSLNSSSAC